MSILNATKTLDEFISHNFGTELNDIQGRVEFNIGIEQQAQIDSQKLMIESLQREIELLKKNV